MPAPQHTYLNRAARQARQWTCALTGKTNLTYEEAQLSERLVSPLRRTRTLPLSSPLIASGRRRSRGAGERRKGNKDESETVRVSALQMHKNVDEEREQRGRSGALKRERERARKWWG